MAETQTQVMERRPNLAIAFQELFTAIVRLRYNLQSVPDADAFKVYMREGLRSAMQESATRGYAPEDIKLAAFAVVAFLDESILNSRNPVLTRWTGQPLGAELTGKHLAGEEFFSYAQQLLNRPDSLEVSDLLEVFYLSLLMGYRGKYAFAGSAELRSFMDSIRVKIIRCRGSKPLISPQGNLPEDTPPPARGDPWSRPLLLGASAAAAIAIVIFAVGSLLLWNGSAELSSLAVH